jgi:WD40 repeat protein
MPILHPGSLLQHLSPHQSHVHALEWLNDNMIITGCDAGLVQVHDMRTSTLAWNLDLAEFDGVCTFGQIHDGLMLIGHVNGNVSLLDVYARRLLATNKLHNGDVRSVCLWKRNHHREREKISSLHALTTSFDTTAATWSIDASMNNLNRSIFVKTSTLQGHRDKILCGAYSAKAGGVVTSGADGDLLLWKSAL